MKNFRASDMPGSSAPAPAPAPAPVHASAPKKVAHSEPSPEIDAPNNDVSEESTE